MNNTGTTITIARPKEGNHQRAVTFSIFLVSSSCCGSHGLTSAFVATATTPGFDGLPFGFVVPPHFTSIPIDLKPSP